MALDEATSAYLAQRAREPNKPLSQMTPTEARTFESQLRVRYGQGPQMASVREMRISGPSESTVRIRLFEPECAAAGVIMYLHGGGWVLGDLDDFDAIVRDLAERTRRTVALVDYRLAPEHPYPAALHDAWTVLQWLARNNETVTTSTRNSSLVAPLIVAGDSAGGNLAAILTQTARDNGGPTIDAQVLVYPVTDCDLDTPCYLDPANQRLLTRESMTWFWNHYLPDQDQRSAPSVSPIRAATLEALPPAVILTAQYDVLRDEGWAYARRLAESQVVVDHKHFQDQIHGFFTMRRILPAGTDAIDYIATALERLTAVNPMRSVSPRQQVQLPSQPIHHTPASAAGGERMTDVDHAP